MRADLFEIKFEELVNAFRCELPSIIVVDYYRKSLEIIPDILFILVCEEIILSEICFPTPKKFFDKVKQFDPEFKITCEI